MYLRHRGHLSRAGLRPKFPGEFITTTPSIFFHPCGPLCVPTVDIRPRSDATESKLNSCEVAGRKGALPTRNETSNPKPDTSDFSFLTHSNRAPRRTICETTINVTLPRSFRLSRSIQTPLRIHFFQPPCSRTYKCLCGFKIKPNDGRKGALPLRNETLRAVSSPLSLFLRYLSNYRSIPFLLTAPAWLVSSTSFFFLAPASLILTPEIQLLTKWTRHFCTDSNTLAFSRFRIIPVHVTLGAHHWSIIEKMPSHLVVKICSGLW